MGKMRLADEDMIIKPKTTHWASFAFAEEGALFNGSQAEAIAVLIQFCKDHGHKEGFECGMGKKDESVN